MLKLYVIGQEKLTAARKMALRAWNNEEGASLAEYALLIALVLIGALASCTFARSWLKGYPDNQEEFYLMLLIASAVGSVIMLGKQTEGAQPSGDKNSKNKSAHGGRLELDRMKGPLRTALRLAFAVLLFFWILNIWGIPLPIGVTVARTVIKVLLVVLICYIAFLGAAAGIREDSHLGVTLFRDMLPMPAQKAVLIGIDLILAGFGAVMVIAGITLMRFGWDTLLPMLDIPESFRTLAITSCGALVCLFSGTRAVLRMLTFQHWQVVPDQPGV